MTRYLFNEDAVDTLMWQDILSMSLGVTSYLVNEGTVEALVLQDILSMRVLLKPWCYKISCQ